MDHNGYKVITFSFSGSLFDSSAIICLLSSLSYGSYTNSTLVFACTYFTFSFSVLLLFMFMQAAASKPLKVFVHINILKVFLSYIYHYILFLYLAVKTTRTLFLTVEYKKWKIPYLCCTWFVRCQMFVFFKARWD